MTTRDNATRIAVYSLLLTAVWWVLSGKMDLLHFGTGVVSAIVIAATVISMDDGMRLRTGRFIAFLPWLFWQIIVSNFRVARMVLSRRMDIRPTFISQPPGVKGDRALTVLGISATLTPGTLVVEADSDDLFVHALDVKSSHEIREEYMAHRVARLFSKRKK
jgi:multicomponent Na+:H+ antiporter subunit E